MLERSGISRNVLFYISTWMVIALIHFVIIYNQYGFESGNAVAEVLVMNLIYALLGVGLWHMVKISDYEKLSRFEMIWRLAASSSVSVIIWLGSSYLLLGYLTGYDDAYSLFLSETLMVRIMVGLLLYIILVSVFYLVINYENLREHRTREQLLQTMLYETELNALRSQIKPHFLFNSLNSISSLTITNPAKAQEMVINLSEFMRYSLSFSDNSMSSLSKELYHLRLYLEIEKVRFGGRLQVSEQIDELALGWPLPPMILQPLVENAVKHGVYDTPGASVIQLNAQITGPWLEVRVINNHDPSVPGRKGTGTGLSNVMKRMRMVYGMPDLVNIRKTEDAFEVKLKFPENVKDQSTDNR